MPHETVTVGAVQVMALCDVVGDFPVALDLAFPEVAGRAWEPYPAAISRGIQRNRPVAAAGLVLSGPRAEPGRAGRHGGWWRRGAGARWIGA
jgi:hypothetical protein